MSEFNMHVPLNKWIFKCFLKLATNSESFTQDGKQFHNLDPAAENGIFP